ncbi:unnamed protein product [Rotaria sordida]|uniref:Uncharacterized protein n=1 Tax=Rotaria sordida TaxID=392033 RepID=A0A815WEC0_9BILA|nr:unnamed protein product [Rotaria sordida]CAF1542415.1 unnamed protein product [Rotaria sordida]
MNDTFYSQLVIKYYDSIIILNQLDLDRETLIAIGIAVGSDHIKGIPNTAVITALEILQEFRETPMERLEKFRLIFIL